MTTKCKILQLEKIKIYKIKIATGVLIYPQDLQEGLPTYRRSFNAKKEHPVHQNMKFRHFFYFLVVLPSWIWIRIHNADPDPADQNKCRYGFYNTDFC
jgi:hypothetical protein